MSRAHLGSVERRSARLGFLEREHARVERALAEIAAAKCAELPSPLRAPVEYALSTSGKRIRPILCIAAYAAARGGEPVPPAAYRLSCAIEIVHTYSLIHDDLPCMDDDTLRRGRPTVHVVHGVGAATVAGAALLPMAIEVLIEEGEALGLDVEERGGIVIELAKAAGAEGMVGGQLMDLEAEGRAIDGPGLEAIHRRKTGALLASALRIGALAGRAEVSLLAALTAYGHSLGLAFQIADDLLDVEGQSADIGKTAGRDVLLEKASYPSLYGVEVARRMAREKAVEARDAIAGYGLGDLETIADYVTERRR